MQFGVLRVINDDVIKAGAGFDTHPHRNMEIITYVREDATAHRDCNGNISRTVAADVQVMSAVTGEFHSEFNLESEDTNIFQIWIEPNQLKVKPRWGSYQFPKEPTIDSLMLLVSGDGNAPLRNEPQKLDSLLSVFCV
jgi:redox-sensitive bicupin YhaK (pirin superfamily)